MSTPRHEPDHALFNDYINPGFLQYHYPESYDLYATNVGQNESFLQISMLQERVTELENLLQA